MKRTIFECDGCGKVADGHANSEGSILMPEGWAHLAVNLARVDANPDDLPTVLLRRKAHSCSRDCTDAIVAETYVEAER